MHHTSAGGKGRRALSILLWLALSTGLSVSLFTLIEELCLATACRDTANFTFFGIGVGWLGIAYFGVVLLVLWLRHKLWILEWLLTALIFSGTGAEFRLLWIQKYIIGSWCPFCVTICCALFAAALLLTIEGFQNEGTGVGTGNKRLRWFAFVTAVGAIGLVVAVAGVKALE